MGYNRKPIPAAPNSLPVMTTHANANKMTISYDLDSTELASLNAVSADLIRGFGNLLAEANRQGKRVTQVSVNLEAVTE